MSRRSCPTLNILLATVVFWTSSCSSFIPTLGNVTATPISSSHNTLHLSTATRPSTEKNLGEVVPAAFNTSYGLTSSDHTSTSQSECSYVLAYATFWPGPSVITRTDSTICPSLASKDIMCTQHRRSYTDHVQHLQCHRALTQLPPFRVATVCTRIQLLRPVVHTMTLAATQNALLWPPHAVLSGSSGLRGTAISPSLSRPLPFLQQRLRRRAIAIQPLW